MVGRRLGAPSLFTAFAAPAPRVADTSYAHPLPRYRRPQPARPGLYATGAPPRLGPVPVPGAAPPSSFWAARASLAVRARGGDVTAGLAVRQLDRSRADNTWSTYDGRFNAFDDFCQAKGYVSLPAEPPTVVHYMGHLEHKYRTTPRGGVHPDHIQNYLSAINTTHVLSGFERPALGPLVKSAREGFRRSLREDPVPHRQGSLWRSAIKTNHVDLLLELAGWNSTAQVVREVGAVVLGFLFGERPVSIASVIITDINITEDRIIFTESRTKTKTPAPPRQVPLARGSRRGFLLWLLFSRLTSAPISLPGSRVFPGLHAAAAPSSTLTLYVQRCMTAINATADEGSHYTSYSLRRGCATAMYTINVATMKALMWGNWQDIASYRRYVDTRAQLSVAGTCEYFGFLLTRE